MTSTFVHVVVHFFTTYTICKFFVNIQASMPSGHGLRYAHFPIACLFCMRFQLTNPYTSLTRNAAKQTTTET